MNKLEETRRNPDSTITVLSIGPQEEDHSALSRIIAAAEWPLCPASRWKLHACSNLDSGMSFLKDHRAPLVICEGDLGAATWRDFWAQAATLSDPPFLIVTSRLADEYLWAEALNLGAYDVLAKPFHPEEVVRALSQAWLHRNYRRSATASPSAIGHPYQPSRSGVAV
jgi:DNA-binding response OmpR family regulator